MINESGFCYFISSIYLIEIRNLPWPIIVVPFFVSRLSVDTLIFCIVDPIIWTDELVLIIVSIIINYNSFKIFYIIYSYFIEINYRNHLMKIHWLMLYLNVDIVVLFLMQCEQFVCVVSLKYNIKYKMEYNHLHLHLKIKFKIHNCHKSICVAV